MSIDLGHLMLVCKLSDLGHWLLPRLYNKRKRVSNLQYPLCKMYAEVNVTSSYAHMIKRFGPYNSRCMSRAQLEAVFELLLKDSAQRRVHSSLS